MPGIDTGIDPTAGGRANEQHAEGSTRNIESNTTTIEHASPLSRRSFLIASGGFAVLAACGGDESQSPPSPSVAKSQEQGGRGGGAVQTPETSKEDFSWKAFPGEILAKAPDDITRQWVALLQWSISNPTGFAADGRTGVDVLRELFAKTDGGNSWFNHFYKTQDRFLASRTRRPGAAPYLRDDQYLSLIPTKLEDTKVLIDENTPGATELLRYQTKLTITAQDRLSDGVIMEYPKIWNPLDFRFGKLNTTQKDGSVVAKWQLF